MSNRKGKIVRLDKPRFAMDMITAYRNIANQKTKPFLLGNKDKLCGLMGYGTQTLFLRYYT